MTATAVKADTGHDDGEPRIPSRLLRCRPHVVLSVVFAAAFAVVSVAKTLRGGTTTYDLAIFTESVKAYAHLHAPIVAAKAPGFDILGDHWSPIIATLAPAWWLWPSALMLQTAQAVLVGVSVGVVADAVRRVATPGRAVAVAVAYGLSFGVQEAVQADFHEVAFAVPILAVVMRQLLLDRPVRALGWSLPLLLVKEDMGLTVAAVGLLVAWRWPRVRGKAVATAVGGIAAMALELFVLIPAFNPQHHYAYFSEIPGGSLGNLSLWAAVTGLLWPSVKWSTLGWTFGVTGFTCLRSPYVLLAVPDLVWRFMATQNIYWTTFAHYSVTTMPIVFLAAVDGLRRMETSRWGWQRIYRRQAVPVMVAAALVFTCDQPLMITNLFNSRAYPHGPHTAALDDAAAVVPTGVSVSTVPPLMAALSGRDDVAWLGTGDPRVKDWAQPQYVVNDNAWLDMGDTPAKELFWVTRFFPGTTYRCVFNEDGVMVFQRTS